MVDRKILTFSVAYAAYVAFLHAVPGPWRTWKVGYEGRTTDPWTLQHVLWGALARQWGLSQQQLLALGVLNEGIELATRTYRPDLLWGTPESGANVVADLTASAVGWWLTDKVKR